MPQSVLIAIHSAAQALLNTPLVSGGADEQLAAGSKDEAALLRWWQAHIVPPAAATQGIEPRQLETGGSSQCHKESQLLQDALGQLLAAMTLPVEQMCAFQIEIGSRLDCKKLQDMVLQGASLVLCTVSMAGGGAMAGAGEFDVCVVDEAAQLVEAHSAIILNRCPELHLLVLVGDHMQLPATVISQEADDMGYGVSMFERLANCGVRYSLGCDGQQIHSPPLSVSAYPLLKCIASF